MFFILYSNCTILLNFRHAFLNFFLSICVHICIYLFMSIYFGRSNDLFDVLKTSDILLCCLKRKKKHLCSPVIRCI